jgi:hypothetical protein
MFLTDFLKQKICFWPAKSKSIRMVEDNSVHSLGINVEKCLFLIFEIYLYFFKECVSGIADFQGLSGLADWKTLKISGLAFSGLKKKMSGLAISGPLKKLVMPTSALFIL